MIPWLHSASGMLQSTAYLLLYNMAPNQGILDFNEKRKLNYGLLDNSEKEEVSGQIEWIRG